MSKCKLRRLTEIWIHVWTGFSSSELVKYEGGREFIRVAKHRCNLFYGCFAHLVDRHIESANKQFSLIGTVNYFALHIQQRPNRPDIPEAVRKARTQRIIERHTELFRALAKND